MVDRDDSTTGTDGGSDRAPGSYATPRTTAPQSPYTARDVGIGLAVLAVGLLVTVAVPLALA